MAVLHGERLPQLARLARVRRAVFPVTAMTVYDFLKDAFALLGIVVLVGGILLAGATARFDADALADLEDDRT